MYKQLTSDPFPYIKQYVVFAIYQDQTPDHKFDTRSASLHKTVLAFEHNQESNATLNDKK